MIIGGGELPSLDSGIVAFGTSVIAFIAWLSRLESKGSSNSRDIERLQERQDLHENKMGELDLRVMEKLSRIEQMVAKIEGKLLP